MDHDFTYERRGRSPRMIVVLLVIYCALFAMILLFDAAWWIMLVLALTTLPALIDVLRDNRSGLCLTATRLDWYSGRRKGTLNLAEVEAMRFDTRWDFSVRVTVLLHANKKLRLPYEATPPHRAFEEALTSRGISVERRHFTVF